MKLWLVKQTVNNDWDTYDSAIVAAETEDDARNVRVDPHADFDAWGSNSWAHPKDVTATLVGEAIEGTEAGKIICASFNAG